MKPPPASLETLVDTLPLGVYVVDVETREVLYANRELEGRMAFPEAEECWKKIYGQEGPCLFCADIRKLEEEEVEYELFNDVNDRWYQVRERLTDWEGRKARYSVAMDITELKAAQNSLSEAHADLALKNRQLEKLSETDGLTGVFNRYRIEERLREELYRSGRYGLPLSVIILDLDHFKQVNDTFGHGEGDLVLRTVAKRLEERTRESDLVGRWGGEEFVVLCSDTTVEGAGKVAESLREAVREAFIGETGTVTASFGVAQSVPGESPEAFVGRADRALYQAKSSGRNRVVVTQEEGDVS